MGLLDWLRRWFGGGSPAPPPAPPAAAAGGAPWQGPSVNDAAISAPPGLHATAADTRASPGRQTGGPTFTLPASGGGGRTSDEARLRSFGLPVAHDAVQLAQCMERAPRELLWLADPGRVVARRGGHYQPIVRRKRGGRVRLVLAPRMHLKAAQRWVLRNILDRVQPHAAAHGFRRGRSIRSHARGHAGCAVVVQCDLEQWFHQFTYAQVRDLFRLLGYARPVARLLALLCTAPVREMTPALAAATGLPVADVIAATRQSVRGTRHALLPQGAPTSPALANLLSEPMDAQLAQLAHRFGATYSRYADDCAFSGGAQLSTERSAFLRRLLAIVHHARQAPSPGKLWIRRRGAQQLVTGLVVNDQARVPRTEVRRLRAILHNCGTHGPASQNRDGHPDFPAHLLGRIAHVAAADAAQGATLRHAFDQITW
ncbi:MAG: reverse transcriptase family protein [Planctomycetota bacterium]|jgi:hypothetical protein